MSAAASRYRAERMSSRNAIIVAAATVNAVAYVSRSSLSVMLVPMSAEFGWSHHELKGHLLSAFFYGATAAARHSPHLSPTPLPTPFLCRQHRRSGHNHGHNCPP